MNYSKLSHFYFLLLISLFLFPNCSLNDGEDLASPTPSTPPNQQSTIEDKSPSYSAINSQTSSAYANRIFPGFYVTLERASAKKFQLNEQNPINADFRFWDPSKSYLDYNQDGRLDMFALLTNFKDPPYGSNFGKVILVDDVLGLNPKIKITDSNRRFMPRLKVLDINKDGALEVLFSTEEDHVLLNGAHGAPAPFQLATISKSGEITYKEIGEPVSIHGQSFGDVDNDGDLDILVWRNAYTNPNNQDLGSLPILYLNDGATNFTQTNSFSQFVGLATVLPVQPNGKRKNYPGTTVDLFDVDGDGNLDVLTSSTHNQTNFPSWEYNHTSTRIYWGNGSGTFDVIMGFTDLPIDYLKGLGISSNTNVSPLGFSYLDFDKDGDLDIFTVSTPDYGGYIIQLCENKGSRNFSDVTNQKFDTYSSIFPRNSQINGSFPNFYEIRIYDKDNDGDYDLVPDQVATWGIWEFPISQNLYWENTGGFFRLRK